MPNQDSDDQRRHYVAYLIGLYVLAEQQFISGAAGILRKFGDPSTALPKLRRLGREISGRLAAQTQGVPQRMLDAAAQAGADAADDETAHADGSEPTSGPGEGERPLFDLSKPHSERAAEAIVEDLTSELEDVRFRITRLPDDVFKEIAPGGAIDQVLERGLAPAQAQAIVWRQFMDQGVTGFVDRSGRRWSLSAYVEMAVRTASMRAFNSSHLQRYHALGINYFTIPWHAAACPLCFPWQGKILTAGANTNPSVHVDGTIEEATIAGLFHPNCEHTLSPYLPGVTKVTPAGDWTEEMADAYKATQKQRRLEVEVRRAKRAAANALTAQARLDATRDVHRLQQRLREHVDAYEHLARRSRREQPDMRNASMKLPELT